MSLLFLEIGKENLGWMWTETQVQPNLEKAFGGISTQALTTLTVVRFSKYKVWLEKSFGHSEWDGQLNLKSKEEFILRCLKNEQDGARIIEIDGGLPKIIKLT